MFIKTKSAEAFCFNLNSIDTSKDTVLFIAGAGMDHRIVKNIEIDKEIFNPIISIDLPGHGSSPPKEISSIESYGDFICEVVSELNLKNFHICGHSMGGLIALNIASKNLSGQKSTFLINCLYPLFVGSLLLEDSIRNLDAATDFMTKYGVHKIPSKSSITKSFGVLGSSFYKKNDGLINSPYGSKKVKKNPDEEVNLFPLKKLFNQVSKKIMFVDLNACKKYRMNTEVLKKIDNLVLLAGEHDKLAPLEKIMEMESLFKECKIKKMENIGHFPFFEDPKGFSKSLNNILKTYI